MSQDDQQTPAPFCLRLTQGERAELKDKAGSMALGAYIRAQLFGSSTRRTRRVRHVTPDAALLTQILAMLGASRMAQNLNQLAKAVNRGFLPVTKETEAQIQDACQAIQHMRALLLTALGFPAKDSGKDQDDDS